MEKTRVYSVRLLKPLHGSLHKASFPLLVALILNAAVPAQALRTQSPLETAGAEELALKLNAPLALSRNVTAGAEEVIGQTAFIQDLARLVASADPELFKILRREYDRADADLTLIASEAHTHPLVLAAMAVSPALAMKYGEGYPERRFYPGMEVLNELENLARWRILEAFRRIFPEIHDQYSANVQPHSGSSANLAVHMAVLKALDVTAGIDLYYGGHLTHGFNLNFSGKLFKSAKILVNPADGLIDYDAVDKEFVGMGENAPRLIILGGTAVTRQINWERARRIADKIGAVLVADISHNLAQTLAGDYKSPFPHAHFVTFTTHKTSGPRSAIILSRKDVMEAVNAHVGVREKDRQKRTLAELVDASIIPGTQGGPKFHDIAAKAIWAQVLMSDEFINGYAKQIGRNAVALAEALQRADIRMKLVGPAVPETHLILLDVRPFGINGHQAEKALESAGILANANFIPVDPVAEQQLDMKLRQTKTVAGGVRIGVPGPTSRGMKEPQMKAIADAVAKVLANIDPQTGKLDSGVRDQVRAEVKKLTGAFPVLGEWREMFRMVGDQATALERATAAFSRRFAEDSNHRHEGYAPRIERRLGALRLLNGSPNLANLPLLRGIVNDPVELDQIRMEAARQLEHLPYTETFQVARALEAIAAFFKVNENPPHIRGRENSHKMFFDADSAGAQRRWLYRRDLRRIAEALQQKIAQLMKPEAAGAEEGTVLQTGTIAQMRDWLVSQIPVWATLGKIAVIFHYPAGSPMYSRSFNLSNWQPDAMVDQMSKGVSPKQDTLYEVISPLDPSDATIILRPAGSSLAGAEETTERLWDRYYGVLAQTATGLGAFRGLGGQSGFRGIASAVMSGREEALRSYREQLAVSLRTEGYRDANEAFEALTQLWAMKGHLLSGDEQQRLREAIERAYAAGVEEEREREIIQARAEVSAAKSAVENAEKAKADLDILGKLRDQLASAEGRLRSLQKDGSSAAGAEEKFALRGHDRTQPVTSISISRNPRNDLMVTSSADGTIRFWSKDSGTARPLLGDLHKGNVIRNPDKEPFLAVAFRTEHRGVLAVTPAYAATYETSMGVMSQQLVFDPPLKIANLDQGSLALSPGRTSMLIVEKDAEEAVIRNLAPERKGPDGQPLQVLARLKPRHGRPVSVAYRPAGSVTKNKDGLIAAVGTDDGMVEIWDIRGAAKGQVARIAEAKLHDDHARVLSLAFSPVRREKMIASADDKGQIRLWYLRGSVQGLRHTDSEAVRALAFRPNGKMLASAGESGHLYFWNTETASLNNVIVPKTSSPIHTLTFYPNGKEIAVGPSPGVVRVWKVSALQAGAEEGVVINTRTDLRLLQPGGSLYSAAEGVRYRVDAVLTSTEGAVTGVQASTDPKNVPHTQQPVVEFKPPQLLGYVYREPVSAPQQATGHVLDAGLGWLRSRMDMNNPYFVVAEGAAQAIGLVSEGVPATRIVALVSTEQERFMLTGLGIAGDNIFLARNFTDWSAAREYVWKVASLWLQELEGVDVKPLRVTDPSLSIAGLLSQLGELLPTEWQRSGLVTSETAETVIRLYQLGV